MVKILHFADAHIDMANYGRRDPVSGLPLRVLDFLKSLDQIVDAAIAEKVDLVIFAGDAYKDRNPAPTFQREWGKRIMRLSSAKILTLLLVGNHDLQFLSSEDLNGLPLQVIALPWISRSGMIAHLDIRSGDLNQIYAQLEEKLIELVNGWLKNADPDLPVMLTAHASVQGAKYGGERMVMLGGDLVLSGSLVKDVRLDYVALGHIHKPQNLNENAHPPVIYPGSIERVDFGEAGDDKFYVIADIEKNNTQVDWRQLTGIRPFVDRFILLENQEGISDQLRAALPPSDQLEDAVVRLVIEYPREWESLIDEAALQEHAALAFQFNLVKRPQQESRIRLPEDQTMGSLSPQELLEYYWKAYHIDADEIQTLQTLAGEIIQGE